jgi:hypothetical protein
MKIQRYFAIYCTLFLLVLGLLPNRAAADEKKKKSSGQYACSEPNPASLCNASNTCGSASAPCTVDVKRTASSSSATPSVADPKGNALFCVKAGTTVTWQSSSKNTGFVIDFGPTSPFDPPDAIIGGTNKAASVVAARQGCFKYSVGACNSGGIYGMCKTGQAEAIVIGGQ